MPDYRRINKENFTIDLANVLWHDIFTGKTPVMDLLKRESNTGVFLRILQNF